MRSGQPTRDPAAFFTQPPGTLLPLGGLDAGHKGYGLAMLIEAMTGGLAGHGRADRVEGWGATVCLQLWDPAAFAGAGSLHLARPTGSSTPVIGRCRAIPRCPCGCLANGGWPESASSSITDSPFMARSCRPLRPGPTVWRWHCRRRRADRSASGVGACRVPVLGGCWLWSGAGPGLAPVPAAQGSMRGSARSSAISRSGRVAAAAPPEHRRLYSSRC
jgi:hypothetical protein